jgi:uncharacterized protein (TIGR02285 family)
MPMAWPFDHLRRFWAGALLLLTSAASLAADRITWMVSDTPPIFIQHGPFAGQGVGDVALQFFRDRLAGDFEQEVVVASPARIWRELASHDGTCAFAMVRTPTNQDAVLFSHSAVVAPGYRLLFPAARRQELDFAVTEDGAVDLTLLINGGNWRGALVNGRAYVGLVRLLATLEQEPHGLLRVPQAAAIPRLIVSHRIEFGILTGLEAAYLSALPDQHLDIAALPIKDLPRQVEAHTACAKGRVGAAVMRQVDAILANRAQWEELLRPMRRWMTDEEFTATLAASPETVN